MEDTACDDDSPDSSGAAAAAAAGVAIGTPVKSGGIPAGVVGTPVKKDGQLAAASKEKVDELVRARAKDAEVIKDLRNQVKKALKEMNEMKLLLDIYKACPQEKRDKAQIMAAEKKARQELDEVRSQLKKVHFLQICSRLNLAYLAQACRT